MNDRGIRPQVKLVPSQAQNRRPVKPLNSPSTDLTICTERFLQSREQGDRTEKTILNYRWQLRWFKEWLEAKGLGLDISALDNETLTDYMLSLKARGLASATRRSRHRGLTVFFNWAVQTGRIALNPMDGVLRPIVERHPKPGLPDDVFKKLLAICPPTTFMGARRRAVLHLLISTGMRIDELTQLKRDDLTMTGKLQSVRIQRSKAREERYAPLGLAAKDALQNYLEFRRDDLDALWISEEGIPVKEGHSMGKDLATLFQRIGVKPRDRAHIFRRTFRIEVERQGISRLAAMSAGGWKTVSVYDGYGDDLRRAENAIPAFDKFTPKGT